MPDPLRHEALPYAGHAQFVSSATSLLLDALSRDERLILLACADKVSDVRDELGADADEVTLVPTDEHGRNPARLMTLLHSFQLGSDERRSFGVSESVVAGRSAAAQLEAQVTESAFNSVVLRPWPLSLTCLYDTAALEPAVLTSMRRSHPLIRGEDAVNADYEVGLLAALLRTPIDSPPVDTPSLKVDDVQLAGMRAFVRTHAEPSGLPDDRIDDLVLAANEIVTNSLRYGGGSCVVQVWDDDGSALCEVRDGGRLADPLVGRFAPPPDAVSGRGLWLANHLCDLVQLRSTLDGTVVRLVIDS